MTTRHDFTEATTEESLARYVEYVVECAVREFEIEQLKQRIDEALDERDHTLFYRLSYQLTHQMERRDELATAFTLDVMTP